MSAAKQHLRLYGVPVVRVQGTRIFNFCWVGYRIAHIEMSDDIMSMPLKQAYFLAKDVDVNTAVVVVTPEGSHFLP